MKCPFCEHENIEGMDQCAECEADLSNFEDAEGSHDFEQVLLQRPLSDVTASDYLDVSDSTSVGETVRRLNEGGCHVAIIHDDKGVAGIFTERDVLYKLADGLANRADAPIRDFMTPEPEGLCPTDPIAFALNRMMVRGFRNIPLLDQEKLVGVVSVRDILEYMTKEFSDVLKPAPSN